MWFDGTYKENFTEFTEKNEKIAHGLYAPKGENRLFFVNDFKKGTPLFEASDPHKENRSAEYVFYHVFFGEEATRVKKAILRFVAEGHDKKERSVKLFRKENDDFFSYGYGRIVSHALGKGKILRAALPSGLKESEAFVVPLNVFYFQCPVCRSRTLEYRGAYEICEECGWEDEGVDDEDELFFGANGEITIREYREKYLKRKRENPDYRWENEYR